MDRWDGETYRRVLVIEGKAAEVEVVQLGTPDEPQLRITVTGNEIGPSVRPAVKFAISRTLGTSVDLTAFIRLVASDEKLKLLAQRFIGVKPPRFFTVFEALINGIACQQLSLAAGIQMLNRLAEAYGLTVMDKQAGFHAFPRPEDLARLDIHHLRELGFNHHKSRAMIELSSAIAEGRLDLGGLATQNDEAAVERLCELHGIGRWTAEYALLRGLGRLHVFPGDDVGARKALERWLRLKRPLDYEGVHRLLGKYIPYAGLIYFHTLLNGLEEKGYLQ